jgi:NADH-dependent peroxiredoxin subunit F
MNDLTIIGGGPAGITAGIYAARKKLSTILATKDFIGQAGGGWPIENYPGFSSTTGIDLMKKMEQHLRTHDLEIKEAVKVLRVEKIEQGFQITTDDGQSWSSKAVIAASGKNPRPLQVKGEEEYKGKGVSYCVTCDGPLFNGKDVAVIGGGNAGFKAALELAKYSPNVYILELAKKIPADGIEQEKAVKAGNVTVLSGVRTKEIKGDKMVSSLVYEQDGQEKEIDVKGIFVEVGSIPATEFLNDLAEFNQRGELIVDPNTGATSTQGLFGAGDMTDVRDKQIVVACGNGAKTALSVYNYLNEN